MKKRTLNKTVLFVLAFITALITIISCIDEPIRLNIDKRSIIISFITEQSVYEVLGLNDRFNDIEAEEITINGI